MEDINIIRDKIQHLKVLFVDDEEQIREGTYKLLSKFFTVVKTCKDGQEGVELFTKENDFDIVITDIRMPKLNGIDMIKKIKEINPNVFVIFITASRGKLDINENLYNLYLTKPILYDDIKTIINEAYKL